MDKWVALDWEEGLDLGVDGVFQKGKTGGLGMAQMHCKLKLSGKIDWMFLMQLLQNNKYQRRPRILSCQISTSTTRKNSVL
jgi:hypothetical protein